MLPFTKRPGRDESGDEDVVTRDDVVMPAAAASAPKGSARAKFPSLNDDDMTTLMAAKSLGDAAPHSRPAPSVRPAAGAPPSSKSIPPPRSSNRPPPNSAKLAADDEEDGRTVVRGAPKIVKRKANANAKMGMPTSPTTISPAAVIKATLESARAGVKPRTGGADHLMAGPPQDLLEDLADRHAAERPKPSRPPPDVGAEHTAILKSPNVPPPGMIQGVKALSTQALQPQALPQGTLPPGSSRPMSVPPPSSQSGGYAAQSGGYASQSGGYASQSGGYSAQSGGYAHLNGPVPSGSVSVPGVSMPAHFMVPQPPYSDGRMDPAGTAISVRGKSAGRSGMSWAMALSAFGLFVGIGALAVMNGNADGVIETSASFVDPSRAAGGKAAGGPLPTAAPTAAPIGVPVAADPPPAIAVTPVAVPAAPPGATATAIVTPPTPPPVTVAQPAPAAVAMAAPKPAAPAAAAPPPRPAPVVAAAPTSRPVRQAPAAAEEPVAAKPAKPAKGGKGGEVDDETKKALDELQKAQLERSF